MIRFLIIALLLSFTNVYAGPLKDIGDAVNNFHHRNESLEKKSWFKDNPNLQTLFLEENGSKALFAWIGEASGNYFRQDNIFNHNVNEREPFITYKGIYLNREREKLTVKIFVPHPKIGTTIELGLNKTINNLMPPHIPVFFEKKVSIKGIKGKLYLHESKACSILLYFPSSTILRTYKKQCTNSKDLEEFTESFDLTRLKLKLTKPEKNRNI